MSPSPASLRLCVLLTALLLPLATRAQIAAGKDKFLGNIVANSVPASFGTYWNQITPENSGKWGSVEGTRNVMNWTALDTAYNYAKANGFKFKAHTLVWGSQYPAWITGSGLTQTERRAEIEEWMNLLAARYPDLWAIDVVNEPIKTPMPAEFKAALGGDGTTGWDWVITSFQLARAKFPNAKLFLNEYGTENDATVRNQMITIINLLKARNLIDGIGIQGHYFNLDNMTAAQMTVCLEAYAATGLDLYITELDLRGPLQTEASQSAQYQEIFPAIWTHPGVKGVTLWGYIEGQTWRSGTGILNSNGTERAALTWLKGYLTGTTPPPPPTPTRCAIPAFRRWWGRGCPEYLVSRFSLVRRPLPPTSLPAPQSRLNRAYSSSQSAFMLSLGKIVFPVMLLAGGLAVLLIGRQAAHPSAGPSRPIFSAVSVAASDSPAPAAAPDDRMLAQPSAATLTEEITHALRDGSTTAQDRAFNELLPRLVLHDAAMAGRLALAWEPGVLRDNFLRHVVRLWSTVDVGGAGTVDAPGAPREPPSASCGCRAPGHAPTPAPLVLVALALHLAAACRRKRL